MSKVFELTEDWYDLCAEVQYNLDYEADNSLPYGNGYIYMNMNVAGLCNVRKPLTLRETRREGTLECTIKANDTRHIMVSYTLIFWENI